MHGTRRAIEDVRQVGNGRATKLDWPAGPLTNSGLTVDLPLIVQQLPKRIWHVRGPRFFLRRSVGQVSNLPY